MPIRFDDRLDILQRTSRSWLALKKAVNALSDAELERPGTIGAWSGRDVLAHVAAWDAEMTRILRDLDAGKPETWPDTEGDKLDEWNEAHVAPYRSLPLAELKRRVDDVHFQFMELLETSPSVTEELVGTYHKHYDEHLEQLRSLKRT